MNRPGVALILGLMMLSLVGTAMVVLSRSVYTDAQRTRHLFAEAQRRQVVLAVLAHAEGALAAGREIDAPVLPATLAADTSMDLDVATPPGSTRLNLRVADNEDETNVSIVWTRHAGGLHRDVTLVE